MGTNLHTTLCNLSDWQYNFKQDEALSVELLIEAFGENMGEHYYNKWINFGQNPLRMISYFGRNDKDGKIFFQILENQIKKYMNRK